MASRGLLVAALGAGLLLVAGCDWVDGGRNTASEDIPIPDRITSVRIANDSGAVTVRAGDRTAVHREVHYDQDQPGATHRIEGDVLVIGPCPVRRCSIDYELTVPAGTQVDGDIDSGRVELNGVGGVNLEVDSGSATVRGASGPVNLNASSGRVHLVDVTDTIVVRSDSGSVSVQNASGQVTVESSSGSVDVRLGAVQSVRAAADSGAVSVIVPQGAYQVQASTDSGSVHSDVADDPAAGHRLDLHTDSGTIRVAYA